MVESELMVDQGWPLELRLRLPDDDSPVEVNLAVVQWSKGQKFGLEFVRLQPEEQARLRCLVSALETGPSPMERRGYPRFVCEYSIAFVGGNITGSGTVRNLSMGGCVLESDSNLRRGDHMKLRINLPEQESPIQVGLATVRWVKGQESGLGFINMEPEEQARLRRFISTLQTGQSH